MDPKDFHKTARILSVEKEEAHIRSSINRSYYGLFLYLREFLTKNGVRLPSRGSKSHHKFVLECIHESRFFINGSEKKDKSSSKGRIKDNSILGIYRRLKTLLQNRTDADYNLSITFRPSDSKDNLRLATTTIQDFDGLGSEREGYIISIAKKQSTLYLNP